MLILDVRMQAPTNTDMAVRAAPVETLVTAPVQVEGAMQQPRQTWKAVVAVPAPPPQMKGSDIQVLALLSCFC